ncbi:unnamed protein product [Spirodela intermedia]|uniref:Uncharacterized protein n=2 Tax=Spirodela intermedia TaxID=51605 RepID=A0A7I8IM40_SPIIN|nr:unnamed protein product [Spirodela intermedia]CAA6658819.1 unnamed protein product [Spirodela intermedia]CAA7395102.1 unnamed protein product [Spirodela intermedia]
MHVCTYSQIFPYFIFHKVMRIPQLHKSQVRLVS